MFARTCTIGFALTAINLLPAQAELNVNYGSPAWGGRMTLAGHAAFTVGGTLVAPDLRADLGTSFDNHVRIDGADREAFFAQGDLDARVFTTLRLVNGVLTQSVNESLQLAGLVRVAGMTLSRASTIEASQDLVIPIMSFTPGGDVEFSVPLGLGLSVVVGVGGEANVRALLVPALSGNPATVTLSAVLQGNAQGRAHIAVGIPNAIEVGVRGTLDYADPSASVSMSTNFRTVTRQLCWSYGQIILALDAFAEVMLPLIGRVGLSQNIVTLATPAVATQCLNF